MHRLPALLTFGVLVFSSSVGRAQTPSGPQEGTEIGPLVAYAVTGDSAGKGVDFAAEPGDRPRVYLFIQAEHWNRPAARFVKALDGELARGIEGAEEARAVAVWLTDDMDEAKEYLPIAQRSLQLERTDLAVFEGDRFGPRDWSIDGEAHLTAVAVRGGKAIFSAGYIGPNETDASQVVRALKTSSR
jgi:hypothetical protein